MTEKDIVKQVLSEIEYGRSHYPAFHSLHEGFAVLAEEVDELWDIVRKRGSHEMGVIGRKECIQIAAVALRIIMDRDLK